MPDPEIGSRAVNVWLIASSYPTSPTDSTNAGVLARDVALSCQDDGHDVTVITPAKSSPVAFDPGLRGCLIPWIKPTAALADINPRNPVDIVRAASVMASGWFSIRRLAKRRPPSATIALWGLPSGVFARWAHQATGAPYAVWLLGSDVWRAPRFPYGTHLLTAVLRDASGVFADGHRLASEAERLTGIPVEWLPSLRLLPQSPTRRAGSTAVAFVGRYHHNKGPDILLEALKIMGDAGLKPSTAFYGEGDLGTALRRRVVQYGMASWVRINGPVGADDLTNVLASVHVLVIPSRVDSIPLILGDAVQTRTPLVVTDVGELGTTVRRFGLGEVTPPDDPVSMAEALHTAIKAQSPTPEAWDRALRYFSPGSAGDTLLGSLRC